jgi:hypothetical protein
VSCLRSFLSMRFKIRIVNGPFWSILLKKFLSIWLIKLNSCPSIKSIWLIWFYKKTLFRPSSLTLSLIPSQGPRRLQNRIRKYRMNRIEKCRVDKVGNYPLRGRHSKRRILSGRIMLFRVLCPRRVQIRRIH